jgi:hypothetical protein
VDKQKAYTGRDIEFQDKEWTAQRIGWVLMVLIVLLAAVGLLGNSGPLARAEREAADGSLAVNYFRLDRHHGPGDLSIEVSPEFVQGGEIHLWLDQDFASRLEIMRVMPEPESVEIGPERVVYVFAVGEQGSPLTISFAYEHDGFWLEEGRLGLMNGEAVEFTQFLFP